MTSRLTSEAFMPSVPMVTPSEMAMVLSSMGVPPGRTHACLHLFRQRPQVEIAGHGLNPGVRDANDRLGQILVRKADGLQHSARAGAVLTVGDDMTVMLQITRHAASTVSRIAHQTKVSYSQICEVGASCDQGAWRFAQTDTPTGRYSRNAKPLTEIQTRHF